MQFLIYIHCHVVIKLPLRCCSSYKRHRLYNQPAKIYLKSSLVICVLTCLAQSPTAGNLLGEICSSHSLQKVRSQSSQGHPALHWGTREAAKVLAKLISLRRAAVPVAIFCVCSKAISSLPPFPGKAPFDSSSSIVRGCGSCPCGLLDAVVLPPWQRWRPQRLWHQFLLTVQGGRPVFLCTF